MFNRRGLIHALRESDPSPLSTVSGFSIRKTRRRIARGKGRTCHLLALILTCFAVQTQFGSLLENQVAEMESHARRSYDKLSTNSLYQQSFQSSIGNITLTSRAPEKCRKNAIVILAQKQHSTYHRDSYSLLQKSLDLLSKNYLSIDGHDENVDVFLFHTGDFDYFDLHALEPIISSRVGIIKLVNLSGTAYWTLPSWHDKDNQTDWIDSSVFSVGYRHMCRWFGIKIWQFFEELNAKLNCKYQYILRIDEDSFILSPINYDIFDYMLANSFVYGFRMCAYELEYNRRIAPWLNRWKKKNPMKREVHRDLCGFYNNFFVADINFFTSAVVQKYLKTLDRQGFIYRKRYGDLMIHSTAVYGFADSNRIHRFLDFTYQHVTQDHVLHPEQGCVVWGGIQAGYADPNAETILKEYMENTVLTKKCTANVSYIEQSDLSPTYQHVAPEWRKKIRLKTIVAGRVELPHKGLDSG